ncbi:membrane-bound lytic murein transglycosylase D [Azoarcus olearius]|uniref:transglycosylase SLT domain-containing protein n=1 Tax=Azoarcus sp. (strain BH72) TaxID=418699 RepID=UPI0008061AB5|nr:transglycosylase SLT domain-containing protein [Azoarcus olearius]ANQ85223.1 membrane-bound lytic murein transglycosylase D [Azoarcus olearius]
MPKLFTFFLSLCAALLPAAAGAQDTPPTQSSTGLRPDSVEAGGLAPPRVLTLDLTRNANDIWDRIRRGFGMPDLETPLVAEQQLFYLNRPAFLKQVFARGGRYLYYIVDELERRGMPTELALLPMVESSYNPMAYSRAHASGLWQFIPSTGKNYNLTQDKWVDERRDVIASTSAALDYLQTIYEMHGDWHLALASYNWGEGAVGRAVQRNVDEGLPGEYARLRMPEETRNYVPKLQAIKNIVARPELFHIDLPYVPNEAHFVALEAPQGIDLATAARLAEMPIEEFVAFNPGFNRPVIAGTGQTLIVPVDRAAHVEMRLNEFQLAGKGWRTYELQPGERLAEVAQRYGLTLAQLQQINGLNAQSRTGPGYSLLVPDGIDPAGALQAARLLPNTTFAAPAKPALVKPGRVKLGMTAPASKAAPAAKGAAKPASRATPRAAAKAAGPKSAPPKGAPAKAAVKPAAPAKPAAGSSAKRAPEKPRR